MVNPIFLIFRQKPQKTPIFPKNLVLPAEPALSRSHLRNHYFPPIALRFSSRNPQTPKNPYTLSYPTHSPTLLILYLHTLIRPPFIQGTPRKSIKIPITPHKPPVNPPYTHKIPNYPTPLYPLLFLIKNLFK